jgi:hypothetical protein
MKHVTIILLPIVFAACQPSSHNTTAAKQTQTEDTLTEAEEDSLYNQPPERPFYADTAVLNDINSDKRPDTSITHREGDGDDIRVSFSGSIPDLIYKANGGCAGADLYNIGDIDDDGKSELMLVPLAPEHACWTQVYIYTLKNNKWKQQGTIERVYICDDNLMDHVKKERRGVLLGYETTAEGAVDKKHPKRIVF